MFYKILTISKSKLKDQINSVGIWNYYTWPITKDNPLQHSILSFLKSHIEQLNHTTAKNMLYQLPHYRYKMLFIFKATSIPYKQSPKVNAIYLLPSSSNLQQNHFTKSYIEMIQKLTISKIKFKVKVSRLLSLSLLKLSFPLLWKLHTNIYTNP